MSGETEEAGLFGASAYWLGLRVVFWLYALFVFLRVAGPAGQALGLASQAGQYRTETTGAVLVVLFVGVLVALFVGLFFAAFLFVSLHGTDVVVSSTVSAAGDVSFVTRPGSAAAGTTVPIEPGLFFPPDIGGLLVFLPPALLLYAGFVQRRDGAGLVEAVVMVVTGYGLMALLTIVPVLWVFNNVVADFVADFASSAMTDATLRASVPELVRAHLLVGVVYPLVFGGAGALVGEAARG